MIKTHKDLDVWKKSIEFVTTVYLITENFPKSELYGLTSQIRRAAISIPSNIAEGATRSHKTEIRQFLFVSLASAAEVETQLIISGNLKYLDLTKQESLIADLNSISKMLQGLIKSITK
jgi:four helix bundle protein